MADILVLTFFTTIAFITLALDYYRKAPYMGAISAITFMLIGVFFSTDAVITQTFCGYSSSSGAILCKNATISSFSFAMPDSSSSVGIGNIGLGAIFMFVGAGVSVDTMVRFFSGRRKREDDI